MNILKILNRRRKNKSKNLEDYVLLSFAVVSFVIIILTTLNFLIHSRISFFGDIDKDYISAYGTFIAGTVGTLFSFAATILVWLTLKTQREDLEETKKLTQSQINLSLKPDVYILDVFIYGYVIMGSNGKVFPWFLSTKQINDFDATKSSHFSILKLNIVNVGVGVAKSISYNWEFDMDKVMNYMNTTFPDNSLGLKYEYNTVIIGVKESERVHFMLRHYLRENYIDILMPYSGNGTYKEIEMPYPYVICFYLFVYLMIYSGQLPILTGVDLLIDYPPCYLRLKYRDMADNIHEKKFLLKFMDGFPSFMTNNEFDEVFLNKITCSESLNW